MGIMNINIFRVRHLKYGDEKNGTILYWMSRDQRANDNWALIYAISLAEERGENVAVAFTLADSFLGATERQYGFMLRGLQETAQKLHKKNIPFHLLLGNPVETMSQFINEQNVSVLVMDFDPVIIKRKWKRDVSKKVSIPFHEVDAHNIVPAYLASNKVEFAARTIRPKIYGLIPEYLDEFPVVSVVDKNALPLPETFDAKAILNKLDIDRTVKEVDWLKPGEDAAFDVMKHFIEKTLSRYDEDRNDPNKKALSNLSPYFHFGQIAPQRVALEVIKCEADDENKKAFFEEMIVRRELSDNFCFYNRKYDKLEGFHIWAIATLLEHKDDEREYVYNRSVFEKAKTHDPLWNAAQREMVRTGKMHGYMRMYWAKKILEWSKSPENAMKIAIYLNDKYSLDGRDPNGYTGIAWSIGGVHDRAWTERPVFGKIRYMNYNGCKRKFDVLKYIEDNQ